MGDLLLSGRHTRGIDRLVEGAAKQLAPWLAVVIVSATITCAAEHAVAASASNTASCDSESAISQTVALLSPGGHSASADVAYVRMK